MNSDISINNVLIVTSATFPYGTAISSRLRAFCALFKSIGYSVHVISMRSKITGCIPGGVYESDGYTFEISSKNQPSRIESFVGYRPMKKMIKTNLLSGKYTMVFSDSSQCYYETILKYTRLKKIPLVIDQCEKYAVCSYQLGYLDARYLYFLWLFKQRYKKASGVIVISRFLETHYKLMGLNTYRIPTILDCDMMPYSTAVKNERIRLVFTGVIWRHKELLAPIIKVFAENADIASCFQFKIYGTTEKQLLIEDPWISRDLERVRDTVEFCGIVAQKDIHDILLQSDYQIFMRPKRESSQAGFPTKFGESMTAGTPIITNTTGDIELYLKDGINGFIVHEVTVDCIAGVLRRVQKLTQSEREMVRREARKTAEENFNYKAYIGNFGKFIQTVEEEAQKSRGHV